MVDGDGVDIDFDKLQSATLAELQRFVNKCLDLSPAIVISSDSDSDTDCFF